MQGMEKKKILIIEDEKPLAHALQLKLSHEGFDVTTTESGQKGLEYLASEHFDLLLIDLIIPGIDGFKVLETIKEKGMKTPAIVITNLNQQEDKQRAFDLGAVGLFVKSNSPISLIVSSVKNIIQPMEQPAAIQSIEEVLEEAQPDAEAPTEAHTLVDTQVDTQPKVILSTGQSSIEQVTAPSS